jgi:hypothetical protein
MKNKQASLVHVDDLHWYDNRFKIIQRKALQSADVVFSTYADVFPRLYPRSKLGNAQRLVWIPHGTTPEFFITLRDGGSRLMDAAAMIDAVLLSG